jgi:membrane protein implicated in regulation of membrane protease activity
VVVGAAAAVFFVVFMSVAGVAVAAVSASADFALSMTGTASLLSRAIVALSSTESLDRSSQRDECVCRGLPAVFAAVTCSCDVS